MSSSQEMITDWRTQTVAMEGATFVLVCTQILTADNRDKTKLNDRPFVELPGGGFAMIYGPDGAPLAEALAPRGRGPAYYRHRFVHD